VMKVLTATKKRLESAEAKLMKAEKREMAAQKDHLKSIEKLEKMRALVEKYRARVAELEMKMAKLDEPRTRAPRAKAEKSVFMKAAEAALAASMPAPERKPKMVRVSAEAVAKRHAAKMAKEAEAMIKKAKRAEKAAISKEKAAAEKKAMKEEKREAAFIARVAKSEARKQEKMEKMNYPPEDKPRGKGAPRRGGLRVIGEKAAAPTAPLLPKVAAVKIPATVEKASMVPPGAAASEHVAPVEVPKKRGRKAKKSEMD